MCTVAASVNPPGREPDSAEDVEADPEPPGELVAQIGGSAQPLEDAYIGGIQAGHHHKKEDRLPKGEAWQARQVSHDCPLDRLLPEPSAAATSSRRCVIQ